jgi:hypothetical protein
VDRLGSTHGRLRTATISGQRRLSARVATIPLGYIASRSGIWVGRLEDRHFFRSLWQFRYTIRTFPLGEMTMAPQIRTAVDFYERHPISAQIILTKLEAARGTLDGLRPDELFPHDQDHYGGTPANDALAKCAHIGSGTKVVDLCAGRGGPAGLRMYQKLRGEVEQAGAPAGHDDFYKSHVLFVSLVQQKIIGGARFAAVKPA